MYLEEIACRQDAGNFGTLSTGAAVADMTGIVLRLPYCHEECVHF